MWEEEEKSVRRTKSNERLRRMKENQSLVGILHLLGEKRDQYAVQEKVANFALSSSSVLGARTVASHRPPIFIYL